MPRRATSRSTANEVGLVAPLPPQLGGVAAFANWLLDQRPTIGCDYVTFDLRRDVRDGAVGGRATLRAARMQLLLLPGFLRWTARAPRLVHYAVSCTPTGIVRDAMFLGLLRLRGRTTIAHVHGPDPGLNPRPVVRLGLAAVRVASSLVVVPAPSLATSLARHGVRAATIFNPVRLRPDAPPQRADAGAPFEVIFVGAYGAWKGGQELIEALAEVRRGGIDARLTFVGREARPGDGERLAAAAESIGVAPVVSFAGFQDDEALRQTYSRAHVLVLPSRGEGLPMTLLEAMAFGVAPVATPVGGIPDVIEPGVTGVLVDVVAPDAIAQALRELATDPERRRRIGEAARARVEELAGPESIVTAWRETYRELAAADEGTKGGSGR